jgi:DNA-binding MarR family transcriptional regulator
VFDPNDFRAVGKKWQFSSLAVFWSKGQTGDGIMPCLELPDDADVAPERPATISVCANRDDNVLMRMRQFSRTVTEIYNAELRPFGINAVQFSLLEMIGRMQPTTRADVARKQELDKSTLTRDLKSIISDGWVEEVREGANGRTKPIALTKAGKQLLLDAEAAWRAAQDEVTALLHQGIV